MKKMEMRTPEEFTDMDDGELSFTATGPFVYKGKDGVPYIIGTGKIETVQNVYRGTLSHGFFTDEVHEIVKNNVFREDGSFLKSTTVSDRYYTQESDLRELSIGVITAGGLVLGAAGLVVAVTLGSN